MSAITDPGVPPRKLLAEGHDREDPGLPTPEIPVSEARSFEGYISAMPIEPQTPPKSMAGPIGWVRANLFNGVSNSVLTIVFGALAVYLIYRLVSFGLIDAAFTGADREACLRKGGQGIGACWPMIHERLAYFVYGSYPIDQRWRVDIVFLLGRKDRPRLGVVDAMRRAAISAPSISSWCSRCAAFILLSGFPAIGLRQVQLRCLGRPPTSPSSSRRSGIVAALPIGILLALGRRSELPMVGNVAIDRFDRGRARRAADHRPLRRQGDAAGLSCRRAPRPRQLRARPDRRRLFSAAYMAEVVRGGLQAIGRGQYEARVGWASATGTTMRLIILPQALRIVIPGIVNTFIGAFKDASLVLIIGMFDLLRHHQRGFRRSKWATPVSAPTGYVFAAMVFWICCFGMSRYSRAVERACTSATNAEKEHPMAMSQTAAEPRQRRAQSPPWRSRASTSGTVTSTCCTTSTSSWGAASASSFAVPQARASRR